MVSDFGNHEPTTQERLALNRTVLANERTLLAYARTAIMIVATGATLLKLAGGEPVQVATGGVLIGAGVGLAVWGAFRCRRLARSLC